VTTDIKFFKAYWSRDATPV